MKRLSLLIICLACVSIAQASHIIGGEMYYEYLGPAGTGMHQYRITLKLFRVCEHGGNIAEMPPSVYFAVFSKDNGSRTDLQQFPRSGPVQIVTSGQVDPCIVNPPQICFEIGIYEGTITVPENDQGYTVAFQSCCRDNFIENIIDTRVPGDPNNPGNGATYYTELPGRNNGILGNSSPVFTNDQAVVVCAGKKFTYDFSATDPDGDRLEYYFCEAYGGGQTTDQTGIPPAAVGPPYSSVPYQTPYSGSSPLGADATIDPQTGVISGIAPPAGKYVITVCVREYRGNQLIGVHRKDFHVTVTTCTRLVTASMPDKYADCDGYTINFVNNSTPGKTYYWDFGDGTDSTTTSLDPLQHTYTQDGVYTVTLYVDRNSSCGDSATATVYVFPMLRPDFDYSGLCTTRPTQFRNTSTTSSGSDAINYYRWDFGNTAATDDTSLLNSPTYQYTTPGVYDVQLLIRTSQGCERTIHDSITIYDRPPLTTTSDTALCHQDRLQLSASSIVNGTYAWTPNNYFITGANTATPIVDPPQDTAYTVTFTDATGCVNSQRIAIDIKDTLRVYGPPDSTVCTGDELYLQATADGPYAFAWWNLATNTVVSNNPDAYITPPAPAASYAVEVTLGSCSSRDTINYRVVDPPAAYAGEDTTICYGDQVNLQASGGSSYQWTPASLVTFPTRSVTAARPTDTTDFIVTVTDVLGCPKAVNDTVRINVVPPVPAFAGNDTILIKDQPFQLHATGGTRYEWTPVDGLSDPAIDTPWTFINRDFTYTVTVYTAEGCFASDDIHLRFITGPEIYIPTGFSPNGDGLNDVFRPLPVGIVQMDFFRVFDRWGKMMYSNVEYMKGWDGTFQGRPAAIGTYVWVVQGKDIHGNTLLRKGTVTLVR
ncbi:PKD domain-containing protein [Chitinophaga japonensis]|uniref:PKD domain-containing protein n=1 Tax=Chitinophaga japonensis TaxID=104662 RepID=UPI001FCE386A|nr:PKD domain-containing protein [Chitinophaga japonensis]